MAYIPTVFTPTQYRKSDVYSSYVKLNPIPGDTLTVGDTDTTQRLYFNLPNTLFTSCGEIFLTGYFKPSVTSTDVKDLQTEMLGAFVPNMCSLINRYIIRVGSSTIVDQLNNDVLQNILAQIEVNYSNQYDIGLLLDNTTGAFVGDTKTGAQTYQWYRFRLTRHFQGLLDATNGVLPLSKLNNVQLELYFNAANRCCWQAKNPPLGTITFSYTFYNMRLEYWLHASPRTDSSLLSASYRFQNLGWYPYIIPLQTNQTKYNLIIPSRYTKMKSAIGLFIKQSDETSSTNINKLYYSTDEMKGMNFSDFQLQVNQIQKYQIPLDKMEEVWYQLFYAFPEAKTCFRYSTGTRSTWMAEKFILGLNFSGLYTASNSLDTSINNSSASSDIRISWTQNQPFTVATSLYLYINYIIDYNIENGVMTYVF